MWKPKDGEVVFSVRATKDFRFTSTKLEWKNNDKVLQRAFEQGVIFKYADEALELCRKMNYLIDNFKNSEMENEFELKPFDKVLVRDYDDSEWRAEFYTQYIEDAKYKYLCLTTGFKQCIPYEGNEHLLGTTDIPQKEGEQEEKQDEVTDNYGYLVKDFKRRDVVLCRDAENEEWNITSFVAKGNEQYPFQCSFYRWKYCIPYEGNEHLLGTTDKPERYDSNKNILFGIKLKPGYVLEFEDDEIGVLIPTANGFAVSSYAKGLWPFLKDIKKDSIVRILGIAQTDYLRSGELLWEKPKKQTFTKAGIAERLGMNVQDFEIIDEDNEENK